MTRAIRNWVLFAIVAAGAAGWAGIHTGLITGLLAGTGSVSSEEPPTCIAVHLSGHNLFLREDYVQGADVQGQVAAGGNITLEHFSIGAGLPDSSTAQALVAGGQLSLSHGGVHGNAWYGGSYSAGPSVSFTRGAASQGTPIDFEARFSELSSLSSQLAQLPANGSTTREPWGGVMLQGTAPDVNVFQVSASAFTGATLLSLSAPAGSLAVVNISGSSATFTGFGHSFGGGIDARGVLYNFVEATDVNVSGFGFAGTILAPQAHFHFSNGSFSGGLYARALTGNASGQLQPLTDREICPSGETPNRAPTVAITHPQHGTSLRAPAAVEITVSASDSDGSIARVDFFSNGHLLGSDAASPYAFSVSQLLAGTYTLTARATDDRGTSATSEPVTVIVTEPEEAPNQPPTVTLTSPGNGTTLTAPATIQLAASASDSDGTVAQVDFLKDGVVVASSSTPPHAATLTEVPVGSYTFIARATDDRGAVSSSAPAAVTVNGPQGLSLTITSPALDSVVDGEEVLVSGTFEAPAGSSVTVNGVRASLGASSTFSALVPLTPGHNLLTATLTSPEGQTVSRSTSVTTSGAPFVLQVKTDVDSGFAPLTVTFSIKNRAASALSVTLDGSEPVTLQGGATVIRSRSYPAGLHVQRITARSSSGATSSQGVEIEVLEAAAVDQQLRATWAAMNNALIAGDKATAMSYLNAGAREKYGPVFDALMPRMPTIIASYSPPQPVKLTSRFGTYAVNRTIRGVNRVFLISFLRDPDGLWLIDAM